MFGTDLTGDSGDKIRCCHTALWVAKDAPAGTPAEVPIPVSDVLHETGVSLDPRPLNNSAFPETDKYEHDAGAHPISNTV